LQTEIFERILYPMQTYDGSLEDLNTTFTFGQDLIELRDFLDESTDFPIGTDYVLKNL
jgi:hypothetical protein